MSTAAERRTKRIAEDRRIEQTVIKALMGTVDGRRWAWLQMEPAQLFVQNGNLDPTYMAFEKGKRCMALMLLSAITTHSPAEYVRMLQENANIPNLQMEVPSDDRYADDPNPGE